MSILNRLGDRITTRSKLISLVCGDNGRLFDLPFQSIIGHGLHVLCRGVIYFAQNVCCFDKGIFKAVGVVMHWLFFADTPLQIYHSILIVTSELDDEDSAELVISEQFKDVHTIGERLESLKSVFSVVHYCPSGVEMKDFRKIQLAAYFGISLFVPEYLRTRQFDVLALSAPTYLNSSLFVGLKRANPLLEVILYDDGTGSSTGEVFRGGAYLGPIPKGISKPSVRARLYRLVFGLVPSKYNTYTPKAIFLRCPENAQYNAPFPLKPLHFQNNALPFLEKCFAESDLPYLPNHSVLFLDVPRGKGDTRAGASEIDSLIKACYEAGLNCALRNHPRTTEPSEWSSSCMNYSSGLWELICHTRPLDDCLLVGFGSTAQLAPVIETGAKPFLIFLYKLRYQTGELGYSSQQGIANMAKQMYGDGFSDRVYEPETMEEAVNTIKKYAII